MNICTQFQSDICLCSARQPKERENALRPRRLFTSSWGHWTKFNREQSYCYLILRNKEVKEGEKMKEEKENAINKGIDEKYFNILNSSGTKGNEL